MVNSGKQLIPCETKISAYTGETPMPPWPLRLTPFPHTSGFLRLEASFAEVGPASLEVVQAGSQGHRRWAHYLSRHHYLGLRVVGQNVGYLARDRFGREVGALLFGAPAWRCAGRDAYLQSRGFCSEKGLARIANNTRFLIFPWVKIPHLASHILGAAARRIDGDWKEKYGQGLEWLEP